MEEPSSLKKLSIQVERPKSVVWDCGSTLYDSFELKSFKRQLDSAIASRTLSMPHLPDRRVPAAADPAPQPTTASKRPSKISRSLQKLMRSIFRWKHGSSRPVFDRQSRDGFYVLYDKSGSLTTIPEAPEIDHLAILSPEINSLVRRAASERFTATSVGISCA